MGGSSSSCSSYQRTQARNGEDFKDKVVKISDRIKKIEPMIQNGTVDHYELENQVEQLEIENRQLQEASERCSGNSGLSSAAEAINEAVREIARAVGRGIGYCARSVLDVIARAIRGIGDVIVRALSAIGNFISSCLKAIGNMLSRFFNWIGSWFD
uniref:Uncharacterized protein n=2 Tax=Meloidogyne TaxID=189290 RepID=A0A6V7VUY3_MELEN|nr:unnamed protein product [Meloidogyne enterolobii]CAD2178221.1 unnamed protein product [Meloidogyne enterolobii]